MYILNYQNSIKIVYRDLEYYYLNSVYRSDSKVLKQKTEKEAIDFN